MEKVSRSVRQDPAQEHLVSKKERLNERIKHLISLLIEVKRGYNGKPAPAIGITERSDIKNPLPDQVNQGAVAIDQQTDQIVAELQDIIRDQYQYSQYRRKGRTEVPVTTASIEKDAGYLSRALTTLITPFKFSDKDRWIRLRMLRASARMNDYLRDVETSLVTRSKNSIPNAVYKTKDIFHVLNNSFEPMWEPLWASLKEMQEAKRQLSDEEKAEKKLKDKEEQLVLNEAERARRAAFNETERAKKKEEDDRKKAEKENLDERSSHVLSPEDILNIYGEMVEYDGVQTRELGNESAKELHRSLVLISFYLTKVRASVSKDEEALLKAIDTLNLYIEQAKLEGVVRDRYNIYANYVYPLFQQIKGFIFDKLSIADVNYNLVSLSASKPERWVRRKLLETFPTSDSVLRVSAAEYVAQARRELKSFMKELETFHNTPMDLLNGVGPFLYSMSQALNKISKLADMHNNDAKIERYRLRDEGESPKVEIISGKDMSDLNKFSVFLETVSKGLEELGGQEELEEGKNE